jgi:hypothetical protein
MAITLDLSPAIEARLDSKAIRAFQPAGYVLNKFDELPRLAPAHSAGEIIGFDEWCLPGR